MPDEKSAGKPLDAYWFGDFEISQDFQALIVSWEDDLAIVHNVLASKLFCKAPLMSMGGRIFGTGKVTQDGDTVYIDEVNAPSAIGQQFGAPLAGMSGEVSRTDAVQHRAKNSGGCSELRDEDAPASGAETSEDEGSTSGPISCT